MLIHFPRPLVWSPVSSSWHTLASSPFVFKFLLIVHISAQMGHPPHPFKVLRRFSYCLVSSLLLSLKSPGQQRFKELFSCPLIFRYQYSAMLRKCLFNEYVVLVSFHTSSGQGSFSTLFSFIAHLFLYCCTIRPASLWPPLFWDRDQQVVLYSRHTTVRAKVT